MNHTIQQLSVFLENREGRLDDVLDVLAKNDVNIVALSLADTSDYGMLRMIVSDPQKGRASLKHNTDIPVRLRNRCGSDGKRFHPWTNHSR